MKNEINMYTSLSDRPRKNAFVAPEGYFEELPTTVLLKCSVSKEKNEPFLASKPVWWSVAACSLLLLGIWFVVPNSTPSSNSFLSENSLILTVDCWDDYLLHNICITIVEEELFASYFEFTPFLEELTGDDLYGYADYLAYFSFYDYDYDDYDINQ